MADTFEGATTEDVAIQLDAAVHSGLISATDALHAIEMVRAGMNPVDQFLTLKQIWAD